MYETVRSAREKLVRGAISSRALAEQVLTRAMDPEGEGKLVFLRLDPQQVRQAADSVDLELSPIAGLPISIKDLFDIQGEITTAGSPQLASRPPAAEDAPVMARLKRAGAVIVGRTNMTEFAFSGIGLNSHFGTPANPYDREHRRIPGGSTSGGAVSVTDGMALAAIGSDTGGSVRIPAALCGLTGFKATRSRLPLAGVFPLAPSLDSVGTMARTVSCCAAVDAILGGDPPEDLQPANLSAKSLAVPKNYFLEGMDAQVAKAFESALSRLSKAGARIVETAFPELLNMVEVNSKGGIAPAEAYKFHRKLGTDIEQYDVIVRERVLRGRTITEADYQDMLEARQAVIRAFDKAHGRWDAILSPTVPIIAPEIRVLEKNPDELSRVNAVVLRNPSAANFLDRCALTVPCHENGGAPVGLMMIGRRMEDKSLLSIGLAVEQALHGTNRI